MMQFVRLLDVSRVSSLRSRRLFSTAEIAEARRWVASFSPNTVPRQLCEISFSRSSGPGGQNVNKVNSKATLRLPLGALLPLLPPILHQPIRQSRYYAAKSNALVIQADDSRKQGDNVESCFSRLHEAIVEVAAEAVPGETSVTQARRVKELSTTSGG
ncbi:hypothetical protein EJ06DRAFT_557185 [Trichodelitschia bisporula]|uniref:Prokaryotic-type class I peptide chain release factors domain-containing protein n=1 Tax=Trichodelitschia bisporula TaxID=703511 RepID=A0A6G1HVU8_9PEZI|nr:hypothetical protein EJ06DRAFT_557185 [Trichodelitschia bisporula]